MHVHDHVLSCMFHFIRRLAFKRLIELHQKDYRTSLIYLRNLLTHTVNNLLQKLNNVKSIQFFVVKRIFNIIHIICEIFTTIPWVLCKIQLFLFERVKIGSHKNRHLGSKQSRKVCVSVRQFQFHLSCSTMKNVIL